MSNRRGSLQKPLVHSQLSDIIPKGGRVLRSRGATVTPVNQSGRRAGGDGQAGDSRQENIPLQESRSMCADEIIAPLRKVMPDKWIVREKEL